MAWIWMECIHAIQRDSVPDIRNKIVSTESALHHICWWWMTNDMIHTTHLHMQRWLCPPGTAAPHTNYFQTICSTLMDTRTTTFKPTRNHLRLRINLWKESYLIQDFESRAFHERITKSIFFKARITIPLLFHARITNPIRFHAKFTTQTYYLDAKITINFFSTNTY